MISAKCSGWTPQIRLHFVIIYSIESKPPPYYVCLRLGQSPSLQLSFMDCPLRKRAEGRSIECRSVKTAPRRRRTAKRASAGGKNPQGGEIWRRGNRTEPRLIELSPSFFPSLCSSVCPLCFGGRRYRDGGLFPFPFRSSLPRCDLTEMLDLKGNLASTLGKKKSGLRLPGHLLSLPLSSWARRISFPLSSAHPPSLGRSLNGPLSFVYRVT